MIQQCFRFFHRAVKLSYVTVKYIVRWYKSFGVDFITLFFFTKYLMFARQEEKQHGM